MARAKNPAASPAAPHFEAVCERVSNGEFTRPVLRDLGVGKDAFYDYVNADPERQKRYQAAKDDGEEMVVHECIAIADDSSNDYKTGERGGVVVDSEAIQRSKLRVDTRLKALAKFNPKRWGDRIQQEMSGGLSIAWPLAKPKVEQ